MNAIYDLLTPILGLDVQTKDLTFLQISLRGIIVFLFTLVMVRLSSKRSLAEKTAFDAVLIVILASVLARAINGSSPFFGTLCGGAVLVFLHRSFAWLACKSHTFGKMIKGSPALIIENGKWIEQIMHRNLISAHDLEEDLRLNASTEDLSTIKAARVERSGDISFIRK